jgi:hypothetical protein
MTGLATTGAIATLALGLAGFLLPARVAALVGLTPIGGPGLAEVRATYGGLFIGLGGACLLADHPAACATAAAGWLGAALARLLSMARDPREPAKNVAGLVVEGGIGLMLLTGALPGNL